MIQTKPIKRHLTNGKDEVPDVVQEEYRSFVRVAEVLYRLRSTLRIETPLGDFTFYPHDGTEKE